jgi:hypothetical protein
LGLFRRKETLNEKLMREAGLDAGAADAPALTPFEAEPPAPFDPVVETADRFAIPGTGGAYGPVRARRWDALVTAEAPEVRGDEVTFYALPDGSLIVDEEEGDAQLDPLATAVEAELPPPYRAHGVRKSDRLWAVSAVRIEVAELDADGDEIELTRTDEGETLTVDGARSRSRVPELERLGEREGATFAVRATRIDGDLWDVTAEPL